MIMSFGAHQEIQLLGLLCWPSARYSPSRPRCGCRCRCCSSSEVWRSVSCPALPHLALPPDIVLVALLPPLLYSAAFFTSLRDLRTNLRPISLLAVGLVAVTMTGVAAVAHEWLGLAWAPAFALGAIVSPTDALAVTEIAGRVGMPRRIDRHSRGREPRQRRHRPRPLQGRGRRRRRRQLLDLACRRAPRPQHRRRDRDRPRTSASRFASVRKRLDDPPIEVAIAVLTGYVAYLPATAAGVSGVLAAVTAGVYMGWYTPELTTAQTRLYRRRVLGDPHLPRQRAALRPRRPAAAVDRSRPVRARATTSPMLR